MFCHWYTQVPWLGYSQLPVVLKIYYVTFSKPSFFVMFLLESSECYYVILNKSILFISIFFETYLLLAWSIHYFLDIFLQEKYLLSLVTSSIFWKLCSNHCHIGGEILHMHFQHSFLLLFLM